jgi:hypothetical protein
VYRSTVHSISVDLPYRELDLYDIIRAPAVQEVYWLVTYR